MPLLEPAGISRDLHPDGQPFAALRKSLYTGRMDTAAGSDRALAQQLTIVNRKGLHARASARFVRTAECFEAEIKVVRDGTAVNGNSIMGLMMLGAGLGSTILVQATGKQAREALDAITTLVNNGFDEDADGAPA
jgi:phosphocarrier protein HPr